MPALTPGGYPYHTAADNPRVYPQTSEDLARAIEANVTALEGDVTAALRSRVYTPAPFPVALQGDSIAAIPNASGMIYIDFRYTFGAKPMVLIAPVNFPTIAAGPPVIRNDGQWAITTTGFWVGNMNPGNTVEIAWMAFGPSGQA